MVFRDNNNSPLGFDGGGGILTLGATALSGWAAWNAFAVAPVLTGIVGAYALLVVAYFIALSNDYTRHEGFIKFLLIVSVLVAAGTMFFSFGVGALTFAVGDALLVMLLLGALARGLWSVLNLPMRVVTVAVICILIAAPFSEAVESSQKWAVSAQVRDARCSAVSYPKVTCQALAGNSDLVLDEAGPIYGGSEGSAILLFEGSSIGKRARCEASDDKGGTGQGTADPTWYGAAYMNVQIAHPEDSVQPCREGN